jgi:CubicO group peptidase (beta-lactamase class C family)
MRPAPRNSAHRIRAALLLWASLLCIGARASQAPASQARDTLDARVDAIVAAVGTISPTAGVTIGVERMGKTVFLRAYGEADRENHVKATEHTVYGIGDVPVAVEN